VSLQKIRLRFGAVGGVGLGVVVAASSRRARTICIDVDDKKLELARRAGDQLTINSTREQLPVRLLEMTEGRGPDVAIEAIGTAAKVRAAVEEVGFTGRVVYIGYAKEPVSYETRPFVQKELDIVGSRKCSTSGFRRRHQTSGSADVPR
jgi:threonine dehydrogenase-like Zn-dependent dehydrogenase